MPLSSPLRGTARLFLALVGAATLAACDAVTDPAPSATANAEPCVDCGEPTPPTYFTVVDGMLSFSTVGQFQSQMAALAAGGQLDAVSGFTSGFEQAVADDARIDAGQSPQGSWGPYLIEDPLFRSVVNQDGRVRIQGRVWQVDTDHVYAAASSSALPTPQPMSAGEPSAARRSLSGVEAYEIARAEPAASARLAADANTFVFDNGNRRLRGRSWNTGWFLYQSAGAESVSEKKKVVFFVTWWPNTAATSLRVNGTYGAASCAPGETSAAPPAGSTLDITQQNAKKVGRRFLFTVGGYNSQTQQFTAARKIRSTSAMTHSIVSGTTQGAVQTALSVGCTP